MWQFRQILPHNWWSFGDAQEAQISRNVIKKSTPG